MESLATVSHLQLENGKKKHFVKPAKLTPLQESTNNTCQPAMDLTENSLELHVICVDPLYQTLVASISLTRKPSECNIS